MTAVLQEGTVAAVFAKAITKARLDGQAFEDNFDVKFATVFGGFGQHRPGCIWQPDNNNKRLPTHQWQ